MVSIRIFTKWRVRNGFIYYYFLYSCCIFELVINIYYFVAYAICHIRCLLSVCTADGHVKLYRFPYMEFGSEWIEVLIPILFGLSSTVVGMSVADPRGERFSLMVFQALIKP